MALSGVINGTFSGTAATNVKPVLEWKATQNISNNTSAVTVSLVFIKSNSYWYPYNLGGHNVAITINGNSATSSRAIDMRNTSRQVIWSRTVTVPHNADGTKSLNIGGSGSTGINLGSYNVNGSITLNTIPRASSMTIAPTTANFGALIKFTISRASGSFTHTLNYNINGKSGNIVTKTGSTTPSWTIPVSLMSHIPTATSSKIVIWLDTYNGNSKIGSKQYSITANVPANIVPTIESFSVLEGNTDVNPFNLPANNFLQGNSILNLSSTANANNGATVSKVVVGVDGVSSINASSGKINLNGLASHSGAKTARVTVTDSRGRTATRTISINIHAYSQPKINIFESKRSNTNVLIKKNCTFSSVGSNTITYKLVHTNTVVVGAINHTTNDYTFGGYAVDKSFTFTLTVSDLINTATSTSTISTGKQLMHIDKDLGFGIGKYHEKGILDVLGDVYIDGKLNLPNGFESVYIPSNSDLDDYKNVGFYHNPLNVEVQTIQNSPVDKSFSLIVEKHAGIKQTLSVFLYNQCETWTRNYYGGIWGSWMLINDYKEAVLQPASSDFVHYDAGNLPTIYKFGRIIAITGAFKNTVQIPAGADRSPLAKIPSWALPASDRVYARSRNQGSGNYTFLAEVRINESDLCMSRYGDSGVWKNCNPGSWIVIDMVYMGRG